MTCSLFLITFFTGHYSFSSKNSEDIRNRCASFEKEHHELFILTREQNPLDTHH